MTVNTQELREAAEAFKQACDEGLFETEFGTWQALSHEFDQQVSHTVVIALLDEIDALRERLEINSEAPEWDGIACRDETIRNLEREIDALRAELQARQWIDARERLPEIPANAPNYAKHINVLAWDGSGRPRELRYSINAYAKTEKGRQPRWEEPDGHRLAFVDPTHWMPLPAPPQGETA